MENSEIWTKIASRYAQVSDDVRKKFLHPAIIDTVCTDVKNHYNCLDHGCGPGDLSLKLIDKFEKQVLVDLAPDALLEASKKFGKRVLTLHPMEFDTTNETFDSIVLSMVITTIGDNSSLELLLSKLSKRLSKVGRLVIGTTHPCFTFRALSQVAYSSSNSPYRVPIAPGLEITEYHRPLGLILDLLAHANLRILRAREIYDDPDYYLGKGEEPHRFAGVLPMFLILTCASSTSI